MYYNDQIQWESLPYQTPNLFWLPFVLCFLPFFFLFTNCYCITISPCGVVSTIADGLGAPSSPYSSFISVLPLLLFELFLCSSFVAAANDDDDDDYANEYVIVYHCSFFNVFINRFLPYQPVPYKYLILLLWQFLKIPLLKPFMVFFIFTFKIHWWWHIWWCQREKKCKFKN